MIISTFDKLKLVYFTISKDIFKDFDEGISAKSKTISWLLCGCGGKSRQSQSDQHFTCEANVQDGLYVQYFCVF